MSGGSWSYACYQIEDAALFMEALDHEMADLLRDLSQVCRDCEWADSSDTSHKSGVESIARFKAKWFHGDRSERLRGYVDERLASVREGLMAMIGEGGGERDKMAATDIRIDYETRMSERIEQDYRLLDMACSVLYGRESGKGGVDKLMGSAVADCISFRYVDARPWREVAALMGYSRWSRRSLRDMCQRGFDCIDSYGFERVIDGMGDAI